MKKDGIEVYEPLHKKIYLKVYPDRVTEKPKKKISFLDRIMFWKKKDENESNGRIIEITLSEVPAIRIFRYLKLIMDSSNDLRDEIMREGYSEETEIIDEDGKKFKTLGVDELLVSAIVRSLNDVSNPDRVVRFILEGAKVDNEDLVPLLSESQRVKIIRAFEEVNPIISSSQKKISEMVKRISEEETRGQVNR